MLWSFGGSISALIPLYAFGVFSAFTLSQAGMVVRWWRRREPGWQRSIVFNGIGALATFIVLLVVATTKFLDGAWMVVVLLPLLILHVPRHPRALHPGRRSSWPPRRRSIPKRSRTRSIVPIATLNQVALQTLAYARSIARDPDDIVDARPHHRRSRGGRDAAAAVGRVAVRRAADDRRVAVSLAGRAAAGLHRRDARAVSRTSLTVILPEMVPAHWWEQVLHNQTALRLKAALLFRPGIVVASVPYHLRRGRVTRPPADGEAPHRNGNELFRAPNSRAPHAWSADGPSLGARPKTPHGPRNRLPRS